jgi:WD40 repeat protein
MLKFYRWLLVGALFFFGFSSLAQSPSSKNPRKIKQKRGFEIVGAQFYGNNSILTLSHHGLLELASLEKKSMRGLGSFPYASRLLPDPSEYGAIVANQHDIFVFDIDHQKQFSLQIEPPTKFTFATVSQDGARTLIALDNNKISIWDNLSRTRLTFWRTEKTVVGAEFSSDCSKVLLRLADSSAVLVVRADNGNLVGLLEGHGDLIIDARFSPKGNYILTTSKDQTAKIWDSKSYELKATLAGHTDEILKLQMTPDEDIIYTASRDNTIRAWDLNNNFVAQEWIIPKETVSAQFSPDAKRIVAIMINGKCLVWDITKPINTDALELARSQGKLSAAIETVTTLGLHYAIQHKSNL